MNFMRCLEFKYMFCCSFINYTFLIFPQGIILSIKSHKIEHSITCAKIGTIYVCNVWFFILWWCYVWWYDCISSYDIPTMLHSPLVQCI